MLCSLLQSVFKTPKLIDSKTTPDMIKKIILQAFVIAYIWSIGGNIIETHRDKFGAFVMKQFEKLNDIM